MVTAKTIQSISEKENAFSEKGTGLDHLSHAPQAWENMNKELKETKQQVHLIVFLSAIFKEYLALLKDLSDSGKIEKDFLEKELKFDTKTLSDIYLEGKNLQMLSMLLGFAKFAADISSEWIGDNGFDVDKTPFFSENLIGSLNHYAGNYISKSGFQAAGTLFQTLGNPLYQQQDIDNRVKTSRMDPEVQRISTELSKTIQEGSSNEQASERAIQQYADLARAMAQATGQAV